MRPLVISWCAVVCAAGVFGCGARQPKPGTVQDEAMRAGVTPEQLVRPGPAGDYFHDMDDNVVNGAPRRDLTPAEVAGRTMWLLWTGGNDRLWDRLTVDSFGTFDLLKTISSHPGMSYGRHNRFRYLGLVNEPCFAEPAGPDPDHWGLWIDRRDPACPPDPFADADRYPGVRIGARSRTMPVGSYYGEPTGVVGLRLFPNPAFDEHARQRWNADRYYTDPGYYNDPKLVRPYRVGMSCAFCHVGPNPIKPPADPERPKWENLSSNVGAQYFWWDRIFHWQGDADESSLFFQTLHVSRPGTLDTSLVSTDNIANPRTMNAIYELSARMAQAKKWGRETLSGGELDNKQFNDYVPASDPLSQFFAAARHDLDAARAEGRIGLGRRARRPESRVSEHRRVQRGMAAALPRHHRREADFADPAPHGRAELGLLAGDRDADAGDGAVPPGQHRSALLEGCPGRQCVSVGGAGNDRAREGRLRRTVRALPLEQAAAAARRSRPRERQRAQLPQGVGRLLAVDEDRVVQGADADDRARRARSSRTTIFRPSCGSRSRCSGSTPAARWPRTRFATTSGTTSPRSRTRRCPPRASSRSATRCPASRCPTRCRRAAAAISGPHRSRASGPPRRSSRTTPSGRSIRGRRSRRGWRCFRNRSRRCCGRSAAGRTRSSRTTPARALASSIA